MADLKGATPQVEGVKPTSEKEAEPTTPKVEPTVRTYTQKELDEAVGKGVSSIQSQLSLSKAEASRERAEAEQHKANVAAFEAELQDLQRQHDDLVTKQFADDPEARQAYVDRRAITDERRKLTKEKAEAERKLYDAEKLAWSVGMARKADALVKETGIDSKELENCQTEEEMEVRALRFERSKKVEEPEKTPKFDSGISSGSGGNWRDLSPDEKVLRGLSQKK